MRRAARAWYVVDARPASALFDAAHAARRQHRVRRLLQPLPLQRADPARARRVRAPRHATGPRAERLDRAQHRRRPLGGRGADLRLRDTAARRPTPRSPTPSISRSTRPATLGLMLLLRSRVSEFSRGALARRRDGRARLGRARGCCPVRSGAQEHRRQRGRDRHQPRVSAGRHPAALGRDRRLRPDRLEARPHLGADRRGPGGDGGRGRDLPVPDRDIHRTRRERSSMRSGPLRCCCSPRRPGSPRPAPAPRSKAALCSPRRSSAG